MTAVTSDRSAPVVVRPVRECDWPQVHELVVEVARAGETYAMPVPDDEAATRAFWSSPLCVVAVDGDEVLGTAKAGPNREAQGSHVGTASFMVGAAARGRGVGRSLGEHVVAWHRAQGFRAIQFNAVVSTNTAAVALWRSLGFRVVGTVPGAFRLPGDGYADLHVMHLDLTGDVATALGADATDRERLLATAARSFVEQGWRATTVEDVALDAGVSPDAAHRMVSGKGELLWAALSQVVWPPHADLNTTIRAMALEQLPSVDDRLDAFVELVRERVDRVVPFMPAIHEASATDPDARALMQGADLRRLGTSRLLAQLLCRGGEPVPGAADVVHVLMAAETRSSFVRVGWSMERYAAWLRGALDHAVNGCDLTVAPPPDATP